MMGVLSAHDAPGMVLARYYPRAKETDKHRITEPRLVEWLVMEEKMDRQEYRAPTLVEYGRIDQVTLGSTGPKTDAIITGPGTFVPDSNNPGCQNNVPSGYCYHF